MSQRPIIDPATRVTLNDGRLLAEFIYPNGERMLWILATTDNGPHGCCCAECAPHEQTTSTTAMEPRA